MTAHTITQTRVECDGFRIFGRGVCKDRVRLYPYSSSLARKTLATMGWTRKHALIDGEDIMIDLCGGCSKTVNVPQPVNTGGRPRKVKV